MLKSLPTLHFIRTTFAIVVTAFLLTGCHTKTDVKILDKIPDPKTLNESYVSNPDGLLNAATVSELNARLTALDDAGTAHIDVVFVNSIGDLVPKEAATTLFNTWKIGDATKDNGLLILMVKDQRRMEFETGYGLEGVLPDVLCHRIQQEYMVPRAKEENYDAAVIDGVDAVIAVLNGESRASASDEAADSSSNQGVNVPLAGSSASRDTAKLDTSEFPPVLDAAPVDIVAAPAQQQTPQQAYQNTGMDPRDTWNIWTVGIILLYLILVAFASRRMKALAYKNPFTNPLFYLLFIVPVAVAILLNIYLFIGSGWANFRFVLVLYFSMYLYVHFHFYNLRNTLAKSLTGESRHTQYMKWRAMFSPMGWSRKFFPSPFISTYWREYTELLEQLRSAPMDCPKCGKVMNRLGEADDDQFLSKGQRAEEKIDSIDYDVWVCGSCDEELTLSYDNLDSKATECPECHFKTYKFTKRVTTVQATTSHSGEGFTYHNCMNCGYEKKEKFTIAKISTSSSSSSSSSGSSSSRSSSSGGSSGGGGAGSSW